VICELLEVARREEKEELEEKKLEEVSPCQDNSYCAVFYPGLSIFLILI